MSPFQNFGQQFACLCLFLFVAVALAADDEMSSNRLVFGSARLFDRELTFKGDDSTEGMFHCLLLTLTD